MSSSYELKNENTFDYNTFFDNARTDESYEGEGDEENDPTFYDTEATDRFLSSGKFYWV